MTGSKSKTLIASLGDLMSVLGLQRRPHQRVGQLRRRPSALRRQRLRARRRRATGCRPGIAGICDGWRPDRKRRHGEPSLRAMCRHPNSLAGMIAAPGPSYTAEGLQTIGLTIPPPTTADNMKERAAMPSRRRKAPRPSASSTRAAASSSPIRGTSAARATCSISASRRWPPPARASRFAQGYADGAVPRDMMLAHLREIVEATDLPVNADFESGFAARSRRRRRERAAVRRDRRRRAVDRGLRPATRPSRSTTSTSRVARMQGGARGDRQGRRRRGARRPRRMLPVGRPDLDETIRRLKAYSPTPAPTASMRPASARASRSRRWSRPSRRSRSTF